LVIVIVLFERLKAFTRLNVAVGLLAIAPDQLAQRSNVQTPSLASQLPQVFRLLTDCAYIPSPCRSWLASEGVVTFNITIAWYTAIASRLAPTGIGV
jgi:hypothetical protein